MHKGVLRIYDETCNEENDKEAEILFFRVNIKYRSLTQEKARFTSCFFDYYPAIFLRILALSVKTKKIFFYHNEDVEKIFHGTGDNQPQIIRLGFLRTAELSVKIKISKSYHNDSRRYRKGGVISWASLTVPAFCKEGAIAPIL